MQPIKSGKYLDIGCGTGNYTNKLQKNGFDFIGIDPSELMLEKAKLKNEEIHWKIGSAENTGLTENFVNVNNWFFNNTIGLIWKLVFRNLIKS